MLELLDRDAGGRICKLTLRNKTIVTPTIMPVINPNSIVIQPREMKKLGAEIIITNSYIISRSKLKEKISEQGLHRFLKWDSLIYTDSGTFQMYSKGIKDIEPEKIIDFQNKIKSDIITPVDLFTLPTDDKKTARKKLTQTSERVFTARQLTDVLVGPIQGGMFLDLRKKACKEISKAKPDVFAIGGIVPLMEQYRFKELCDIILTCKENLQSNIPVHAFGAGHPMIFALLTSIGCDLFDSAMYSLAAKRNAYLTVRGTYKLDDLIEFPCSCIECSKTNPNKVRELSKEDRELFLAKHNLNVTFEEIRTIRQAIRENKLWELVQIRARSHPAILEALLFILKKYKKYFLKQDPISKRSALFYSGKETELRPEVIRAKERLRKVKSKHNFIKKPFGKIPLELRSVYPFGQSITLENKEIRRKAKPEDILQKTLKYQYGKSNIKKSRIEISRKTGRLRRIWKGKTLLGTIRPRDGLFLPSLEGSKYVKMKKVHVSDKDVVEYIKKGKSLFAKFISKADDIIPGEEVVIVYNKNTIAVGRAILNSKEMLEFRRGVAVKIR